MEKSRCWWMCCIMLHPGPRPPERRVVLGQLGHAVGTRRRELACKEGTPRICHGLKSGKQSSCSSPVRLWPVCCHSGDGHQAAAWGCRVAATTGPVHEQAADAAMDVQGLPPTRRTRLKDCTQDVSRIAPFFRQVDQQTLRTPRIRNL